MAEAGQFLEKGSPKLDILKNLFEKYQIFVQNTQKRPTKLENDRSRDAKKYCP
jgi:hypothetical protein